MFCLGIDLEVRKSVGYLRVIMKINVYYACACDMLRHWNGNKL